MLLLSQAGMLLLQQLQQAGMALLQQQAGMLLLHQAGMVLLDQAGMLLVAENSPSGWGAPPAVFPGKYLTFSRFVGQQIVNKKSRYDPRDLAHEIRAGILCKKPCLTSRDLLWRPIW